MNPRSRKLRLLGMLPDALLATRAAPTNSARYLTFDDGPDPECTPSLLDLLAAYNVRASFFVVGKRVQLHPDIVQRIVAEGHTLGNHSFQHSEFGRMNLQKQLEEIDRTDVLLQDFDGRPRHPIRPPQGYAGGPLLMSLAARKGRPVYWSYDSLDYKPQSLEALVTRLHADPPVAGDIVLMHDDKRLSTEALRILLPGWLAKGHCFLPLPQAI